MKPKKKRVYGRMSSLESWLRLCTDDWKSPFSSLLKRFGQEGQGGRPMNAETRAYRKFEEHKVILTGPARRGDFLACWPSGNAIEAWPFVHRLAPRLAPLIALEDGETGQTIRAIEQSL